jgi:hypothetical protein
MMFLKWIFPKRTFLWAGGMAQMVEHLPSKVKALSSTPVIAKKRKRIFYNGFNLQSIYQLYFFNKCVS